MTDHSFISSARLKIAAALAAAVMLAPVTVPAIGAVAATESTPSAQARVNLNTFNSAYADLKADYDQAVALQKGTAYSLLPSATTNRYDGKITALGNDLAKIKADADAATSQSKVNQLTLAVGAKKLVFSGETYSVNSQLKAKSSLAKDKLKTAVASARTKYNLLTNAQRNAPAGHAFSVAIEAADAVAKGTENPTPNDAAKLIDSLTELGNQAAGNLPGEAQNVQTSLNRLTELAKTTPVFLLNLSDYKNSQTTISTVQKAINDGKANTAAEANVLISQINTSYNSLSNAIKRALSFTGVGTINYVPKYGIQVWTWDGKLVMMDNDKTKAKKLQHGTRWKIFGDIINQNGSRMYNLGGDQFIDANFINYKANK